MVHKACTDFPGVDQIFTLVIPNDYSVEGISMSVAADHEFLTLDNIIFDPGAAALSRLINITPAGAVAR